MTFLKNLHSASVERGNMFIALLELLDTCKFISAFYKSSRCLDQQITCCLAYFFIWISVMQDMLLLLPFTVDCQMFTWGERVVP